MKTNRNIKTQAPAIPPQTNNNSRCSGGWDPAVVVGFRHFSSLFNNNEGNLHSYRFNARRFNRRFNFLSGRSRRGFLSFLQWGICFCLFFCSYIYDEFGSVSSVIAWLSFPLFLLMLFIRSCCRKKFIFFLFHLVLGLDFDNEETEWSLFTR